MNRCLQKYIEQSNSVAFTIIDMPLDVVPLINFTKVLKSLYKNVISLPRTSDYVGILLYIVTIKILIRAFIALFIALIPITLFPSIDFYIPQLGIILSQRLGRENVI